MKVAYRYSIICFMAMWSLVTQAQVTSSKILSESYPMTSVGQLIVNNKYGNVEVNGWDKDSIQVTVNVVTTGDNDELIQRINPTFDYAEEFLEVNARIDPKREGYWSRLWRNVNPIEFDKSSVDITIEIYLPKKAQVKVSNKYGDVSLSDLEGRFQGEVEHGDVRLSGRLLRADVDIQFGLFRAHRLAQGDVKIRNGSIDIYACEVLDLDAVGSEIEIDSIQTLRLKSSKDDIRVGSMKSVSGEMRFSKLNIDNLSSGIDLDLHQTELNLMSIQDEKTLIKLDQTSSEVELHLMEGGFNVNATLEDGLLRLSKDVKDLNVEVLDEKKEIRKVQASYGNSPQSTIQLNGKKGYVVIK